MNQLYINGLDKVIDFKSILTNINTYNDDIVYIGGSLIEGTIGELSSGMGNCNSDLDIFIIRNDKDYQTTEYVYNNNNKKISFSSDGEISYDIEVFNISDIEKLISAIDQSKYDANERVINMIELPEGWDFLEVNTFLTRLKYSVCILNKKCYTKVKNKFNFNKFLELYKAYIITAIDNSYEDLLGGLSNKSYDTALYSARNVYIMLLKVLIMNEQEYIDRDKWAALKFRNIVSKKDKYKDVLKQYEKLFYSDLSSEDMLCIELNNSISIVNNTLENLYLDCNI